MKRLLSALVSVHQTIHQTLFLILFLPLMRALPRPLARCVGQAVWISAVFAPALLLAGCRHDAAPLASDNAARAALSAAPLFRDVAAQAGIRFQQSTGSQGKFYYVESSGSGCAFFDYDNDGYLDVLIVQSGSVPRRPDTNLAADHCALYHNNGDGTFTDVTAGSGLDKNLGYGQGVAVGDYDNDGYDDLYITGYGGNHLLHNEHGSGKFTDVTSKAGIADLEQGPRYATSAAWGDFDNDGHLDLYVCHYCVWTPQSNRICHTAKGVEDFCTPDVFDPEIHRLYRNRGDGTFEDVTHSSGIDKAKGHGLGVVWTDYDSDGKEDLYVANDMNPEFLWHNDGHGKFSQRAAQAGVAYNNDGHVISGMGLGLADYDHSGRESLFVCNFSGQPNTLFHNDGQGVYTDVSLPAGVAQPHIPYLAFGAEFLDYDADGWQDLIVGNGHVNIHVADTVEGVTYKERKQLFHSDGKGHYSEITDNLGDLNTPTVSRGLAAGDYDNDGRVDVLVVNQNDKAQLFHNEDKSPNHWISLLTVGTKSNRDGYQAKLTVTYGAGQHQFSEVHSSSSYLSHSDRRVYFGLGGAVRVDTLDIRWPSGAHDTLRDIAADHSYQITEGKGITRTLPGRKTTQAASR